jgi:hypothetical protein
MTGGWPCAFAVKSAWQVLLSLLQINNSNQGITYVRVALRDVMPKPYLW